MSNVIQLHERYDRNPAASIEAETEVLGAILMSPTCLAPLESIVKPEHFAEPLHAAMFQAMQSAAQAQQPISLTFVAQHIGQQAASKDLGNGTTIREYLASLYRYGGNVQTAQASARMVRDLWALRQVEGIGQDIGRADGYDPSVFLAESFDKVDALRAQLIDREKKSATAAQAAGALMGRIESAMRGERKPLPRSMITRLDDAMGGGFKPSTLIIIPGRPSMGKSILGVELADRFAEQGFGVDLHSLEMSAEQIAARQIASRLERAGARLPYFDILRGEGLSLPQAEMIAEIARDLRGSPLMIEEKGGVSIGEIAATSERRMNAFVRKGVPPGAVIIDHAHLVRPVRVHRSRDGELEEVVDGSLALAKHLDVPVILLAQLNRQTEDRNRDDKRPSLADIRGSGVFEQNADAVIFPYRPAYYVERSPEYRNGDPTALDEFDTLRNSLELIIDKNRAGQSNQVVRAWIDPALNAIRNPAGGQ